LRPLLEVAPIGRIMCQACYDKGFKDYPAYHTSVPHLEDYKRGYKAKQNESMDADELQHTFFCEKCYERGLNNSKIGIWSPPLSTKRGHYESYEKGYNQVEMEQANKIPGYYLPEEEAAKTEPARKVNWNGYAVAGAACIVLLIAVFVIFRFMHSGGQAPAADSVAALAPPVVRDSVQPAVVPPPTAPAHDTPVVTPPPAPKQVEPVPQPAPQTLPAPKKQEPEKTVAPVQKVVKEEPHAVKVVEKPVPQTKQAPSPKPEKPAAQPAPAPVVAVGGTLTESELKGKSKQELKLMRNEIFARHGYIFKSPELNDYFRKKPWYKAQHEDVNSLLSPEERQNVELIKKLER
jgi:YARHG domain